MGGGGKGDSSAAVLLCYFICNFVSGACRVVVCSSSLFPLVPRDCGISLISSLIVSVIFLIFKH